MKNQVEGMDTDEVSEETEAWELDKKRHFEF